MGVKVFRLFNGAEIPRNSNLYADRQYSLILSGLLWKKVVAFPSGLVIPLGLLGIVLVRRCWRVHFVLLACLAVQGLFVLAFFVTARYRLPSLPLLVLYGAFAVETLAGQIRLGAYSKLAVWATAAAALLIFCNIRIGKMDSTHGAYEHNNLGVALLGQHRLNEAMACFAEAIRIRPDYPSAHNNLGKALADRGQIGRAIDHYRRSLQLSPDYAPAHYNIGNALMEQGELAEAVRHFTEALRLDPFYISARHNLGVALARQGNLDQAVTHWRRILQNQPGDADTHYSLAAILIQQGRTSQAIEHLSQVLRINPSHAGAAADLAWLLATSPNDQVRDGKQALRLARRVLRIVGTDNPEGLDTLAAAYAEIGRFDQAVAAATRAVHVARWQGRADLAKDIQDRVQLYQQHYPFRRAVGQSSTP